MHVWKCLLSCFSCVCLCDPLDYLAHQALLSMGFCRQYCWRGLPFTPPEGLPNPGIKFVSPVATALAGGSLPLRHRCMCVPSVRSTKFHKWMGVEADDFKIK